MRVRFKKRSYVNFSCKFHNLLNRETIGLTFKPATFFSLLYISFLKLTYFLKIKCYT